MRPFTVPTISVANTRNNLDIIQEIRDACLLHGFFQVIDHDVPLPLIDRTFATTKAFFELPVESKQSVLKTDHIVGGYEPFRVYNLSTSEPNRRANYGCNEGFAIAPEWGKNQFVSDDILPDFEKDCSDYFRAVAQLGRRLLSTIAEGLNVPGNFFEPYLDHQLSFCRLTHYYRESLAPPGEEEPIGAAAHSDWGSLTVLVQDEIGGLQVFDRSSDTWFDVPYVRGAFVCNIGDLLSRWTNDQYQSTLHRVLAPPPGIHRYSIPFFNPGNPSHLVEVIQSCVPEGENPKYDPITAGEYIKSKHYSATSDSAKKS